MGYDYLVAVDKRNIPQIIFGVTPVPTPGISMGAVWMMASEDYKRWWVQILRETPYWTAQLGKGYDVLTNRVHAKNSVHIRWIKWAGFSFIREYPVEKTGEPFIEFAKITNNEAT
jgi:hypothetical protein